MIFSHGDAPQIGKTQTSELKNCPLDVQRNIVIFTRVVNQFFNCGQNWLSKALPETSNPSYIRFHGKFDLGIFMNHKPEG
jgi:hypothetical protein